MGNIYLKYNIYGILLLRVAYLLKCQDLCVCIHLYSFQVSYFFFFFKFILSFFFLRAGGTTDHGSHSSEN